MLVAIGPRGGRHQPPTRGWITASSNCATWGAAPDYRRRAAFCPAIRILVAVAPDPCRENDLPEHWPPRTPLLTVDAVIRTAAGIVLVRRKHPPEGWALPGGFVEVGETVETAVRREALEETGLEINQLWLVGVYSDPSRDMRFHTVSVVFGAVATGEPRGGDDAAEAAAFPERELPNPIVFDHRRIITDFLGIEASPSVRAVV